MDFLGKKKKGSFPIQSKGPKSEYVLGHTWGNFVFVCINKFINNVIKTYRYNGSYSKFSPLTPLKQVVKDNVFCSVPSNKFSKWLPY